MARLRDQEVAVSVSFVVALFMSIMDSTIVNVALPAIAQDFGTSTALIEWVVIGYLLSLAIWIPASGWIGDRFGTKRTFLFALAVFTGASAACAVASDAPQLVAFRFIQGIGGGMLAPVGTAMLFRAFPPQRRARAAAILIVPTSIAPAIGPILGGFLTDQFSWRWIFLINAPIGIAAFVFTWLFVAEHREATPGPFDWAGFVLSGFGLALTLYALTQAPQLGWTSAGVVVPALLGAFALGLLVRVELRLEHPLLKLQLLRERLFRTANSASFFGFGSYLGLLFVMPLFLQVCLGASPLESGLATFPEAVGVILASRIAGRLYPTVGPRRLVAGGMFGTATTFCLCALLGLSSDLWLVRGLMFVSGCAMAFVFLPLNAATFARVSSMDTGRASAIFNTQRRVAAAVVVALLATVLATLEPTLSHLSVGTGDQGTLTAFRAAFIVDAGVALLGAFVALRIRDRDAAETMRG